MLKLDVCAVEVVPRWQPGLEKQYGAACLRKYDAIDLDPDVPMRAQRVDSHVRVARVTDDSFVFFEPVERLPFEPHVTCNRATAVGVIDARRGLSGAPVRRQRMQP